MNCPETGRPADAEPLGVMGTFNISAKVKHTQGLDAACQECLQDSGTLLDKKKFQDTTFMWIAKAELPVLQRRI